MAKTCSGPSCERPTFAQGLCDSHYRQKRRGRPLAPLRSGPARVFVGLRVSPSAARAVGADYSGAVEALEAWARSR